jgi:septal ring factor EnvC (AmiA/AmiB activator)
MSEPSTPARWRSSLPALCLGLWLLAAAAPAAEPDRSTAEAELQRITKQLNDLDAWLLGAERKRAQWERDIQSSDRAVARLSAEVDAAAAAVDQVRGEIAALREAQQTLQQQRKDQAQHIGQHLTAAYRLSGEDFVKLLLNQQSPETLDRMVRYHRYFSDCAPGDAGGLSRHSGAAHRERSGAVGPGRRGGTPPAGPGRGAGGAGAPARRAPEPA